MNSAMTYIMTQIKIKSVLERHWADTVFAHNIAVAANDEYALPAGDFWEISVGIPNDRMGDTKPLLYVTSPSSSFSIPVTQIREEAATLKVTAEIPDASRAVKQTVMLSQIAARLAADLLETHFVDSPLTGQGPTYRVDWVDVTSYTMPNQPGAAATVTIRPKIRAASFYQPDLSVSALTPIVNRQNLLFNSTLTLLDGITEVYSGTVQPGEIINVESSASLSFSLNNAVDFEAATILIDKYLVQQQLITSTVTAGVVTATFSEPGIYRIQAWNVSTGQSTYVTVNVTAPD